nr:MAG TPA: hypothetical protein [Caudoviricetes sp.]
MFHILRFIWYNTYVKQNQKNELKMFHIKEISLWVINPKS